MSGIYVDVNKLSLVSADQFIFFNNADDLEFIADELQECTLSNTQEKVDITGRGGRKIGSLKKNKAATFAATNGFLVGGALAAQTGTDVEQGLYTVRFTDVITVGADNKAKASKKAVGPKGDEIGTVYRKNKNGSLGEKLVQSDHVAVDKFTYDPATQELAFNTGEFNKGDEIVAFYDIEVRSAKISNSTEKYSKTGRAYIDVTAQDNCDNLYHGQFIFYRADVDGNFDITMGGDPALHNITIESLAGGCSGSTNLWDLIIFNDSDEVVGVLRGSDVIEVPSQNDPTPTNYNPVTDMISTNVDIEWDGEKGTVTGDIYYINEFKAFGSGEKAKGHFFPIKIDKEYWDKTLVCKGRKDGDKEVTCKKDDPWLVQRIENLDENKILTIELKSTGDVILVLDFNNATFETEDEAKLRKAKQLGDAIQNAQDKINGKKKEN